MKNLKKLKRNQLVLISGGDTAYALCVDGVCPPTHGYYYCSGDTCYRSLSGGGTGAEPEAEELIVRSLHVFVWKENQVVDVFTYKNTCFINKSGFYRSFILNPFIASCSLILINLNTISVF